MLPVLLAFSMGMVEFGYFFFCKHTIQAAARDGARTAILASATHAQAQAAVKATMDNANFTNTQAYTVAFADPLNGNAISNVALVTKGSGIRVTVTANYGSVGLRPLGVIPANKAVTGVTTMIKE